MIKENGTSDEDFILLSFSYLPNQRILFFLVFLVLYILTILGNATTILIICLDLQLHTPMYWFLCGLSFLDICNTCVTIPKLLVNLITRDGSISYLGCVAQVFIFDSLAGTECGLLAVMAYDRYLAICNPLHYMKIMTNRVCSTLIALPWLSGFLQSSINTPLTFQLSFCQSKILNSFFCEVPYLLKISCSAIYLNQIVLFGIGGLLSLSPFILTFVSYSLIIKSILKIPSAKSRSKAFSTCSSHLTVVSMFYGAAMFVYFRSASSYSMPFDRMMSLFYTLLTPLLNPIIYTLKNNNVKKAMLKLFHRKETLKYDF
ncbi:olfactory receptor 5AR1-like [Hyperolius riggenbachi]|uniref:olfactory receptor 5AR1-like n=1 Tax=Hyperolius riggenbachi TaxID=752182 RepID=UPI0035A2EF3E